MQQPLRQTRHWNWEGSDLDCWEAFIQTVLFLPLPGAIWTDPWSLNFLNTLVTVCLDTFNSLAMDMALLSVSLRVTILILVSLSWLAMVSQTLRRDWVSWVWNATSNVIRMKFKSKKQLNCTFNEIINDFYYLLNVIEEVGVPEGVVVVLFVIVLLLVVCLQCCCC